MFKLQFVKNNEFLQTDYPEWEKGYAQDVPDLSGQENSVLLEYGYICFM